MFYNIIVNVARVIFNILFRIEVEGEINYNDKSSYILCSNHLNLLDPIILAIIYKKPIYFMAKMELFQNKYFAKILKGLNAFPVDRKGNDLKALKQSVNILKNNNTLGIFIEGTRVKDYNVDNAKPGPIIIAKMAKAKILPIKIESSYKLFSKVKVTIREFYVIDLEDIKNNRENAYINQAKEVLKIIYEGD